MQPEPQQIVVCSICEQPWDEHLRRRAERTRNVLRDPYATREDNRAQLAEHERNLVVLDCIPLLKAANRGPAGPPGVTGPPGMDA